MTTYTDLYIFRQQIGKPCAYCERPMDVRDPDLFPTRDHEHPRSLGGIKIVWACWICNHVKADMTLAEWQAFMAQNPDWWKTHSKPGRKTHYQRRQPEPLPKRDWPWLVELNTWQRHMSLGCKDFFVV